MNRRNFLKAFTGAAVGAAVVAVVPPMPEVVVEALASPATRYATLEEAIRYYEAEILRSVMQTPFLDAIRRPVSPYVSSKRILSPYVGAT